MTEEIAPGVRASTTSYIASMLRPEIVADLGLAERGLRMVPCEPGLQVVFEDRPRAAVVVDARTHRRGDPPDLGARRGRVRPRDRAPPRARPLAAALLPRGAAEPVRDGLEQAPRGAAPVPAVPAPVGRPALGPGAVRDRVARRVRRTAFRVRRGPPPLPGEQRLRDARAALPAGDRDRAPVPHALRRRAPHPGLQRPRDRRDGLDHAGDGVGGPRCRRRDPHGRRGGAHRRPGRPGDGGHARGRDRDPGAHGASRTRTPSARSSAWSRSPSSPRGSAPTSSRSRWRARARR